MKCFPTCGTLQPVLSDIFNSNITGHGIFCSDESLWPTRRQAMQAAKSLEAGFRGPSFSLKCLHLV